MLPRFARLRAVLAVVATLAAAGCSAGVGGAWPGDPGGEALGEDGAAVACEVATDCPRVECHQAPVCMSGTCIAPVQKKPTMCSSGVCTEDGACVPCVADADCERANENECYSPVCGEEGKCQARQMQSGEPCNIAPGGVCGTGANCLH